MWSAAFAVLKCLFFLCIMGVAPKDIKKRRFYLPIKILLLSLHISWLRPAVLKSRFIISVDAPFWEKDKRVFFIRQAAPRQSKRVFIAHGMHCLCVLLVYTTFKAPDCSHYYTCRCGGRVWHTVIYWKRTFTTLSSTVKSRKFESRYTRRYSCINVHVGCIVS